MIVNFIFQIVITLLTFGISVLPNFSGLPAGVTSAFSLLTPWFDTAYVIFPMQTLFQILTIMLSIQIAVWSWDIFWFFYNKMPGKFT